MLFKCVQALVHKNSLSSLGVTRPADSHASVVHSTVCITVASACCSTCVDKWLASWLLDTLNMLPNYHHLGISAPSPL